jgi:hypothetical protein
LLRDSDDQEIAGRVRLVKGNRERAGRRAPELEDLLVNRTGEFKAGQSMLNLGVGLASGEAGLRDRPTEQVGHYVGEVCIAARVSRIAAQDLHTHARCDAAVAEIEVR